MTTPDSTSRVRIGKITGFHGLRGNVKVRPASPDADWVGSLKRVILVQGNLEVECRIESASSAPQGLLMKFVDHPDRTSVEKYAGCVLYAYEEDLPPLGTGEYRADSLIGLTVCDAESRQVIGKVRDILTASGSDFMELETPKGGETAVVPFNDHFFPEIDLENGTVYLAKLASLLNELDAGETSKPGSEVESPDPESRETQPGEPPA